MLPNLMEQQNKKLAKKKKQENHKRAREIFKQKADLINTSIIHLINEEQKKKLMKDLSHQFPQTLTAPIVPVQDK